MGSNSTKFGPHADTYYRRWEKELQEIKQRQKFNPDEERDNESIRQLKLMIANELKECIEKERKAKKVGWICLAVAIVGFICVGAFADTEGIYPFALVTVAGIIGKVFVNKCWRKDINNLCEAIIDFDKTYFEGEIVYKIKNGMSI